MGIMHHIHEFFSKIREVHTGTAVNMRAAHSHGVKVFQGMVNIFFIYLAVPGPEGRASVFAGGVLKQLLRKGGPAVFPVKHLL